MKIKITRMLRKSPTKWLMFRKELIYYHHLIRYKSIPFSVKVVDVPKRADILSSLNTLQKYSLFCDEVVDVPKRADILSSLNTLQKYPFSVMSSRYRKQL